MQGMQDQKKMLAEKIAEYESREMATDKVNSDVQDKLRSLLEQNDELREKLNDFNNDAKLKEVRQQVEQEYLDRLTAMEKQVKEVQAENSEFKAK